MLSPLHLTPIHWTVAAVLSNSRLSLQASIEFVSSGDDSSPFANLTWSPTPDHLVSNEVGMTTTTQPKASMHILKTSADPLVSSVALRAPCETSGSAAPTTQPGADTEVVPRARRRRQFFNADKRRILDAADPLHPARRDRRAVALRGRLLVESDHVATPARGCRTGCTGTAKKGGRAS